MASELIIFPVRIGFRVARLAVRTGVHATEQAVTLAAHAIRSITPGGSAAAPKRTVPNDAAPSARAGAARSPMATPYARTAEAPAPEAPSPRAEPVRVSEEPILVEEFAEPGAEEGAGAEVNVAEPWEGYARMSARDVISRLDDAPTAALAAVQLYERSHKQRETVTSAAERELRRKSGRGAATADQPTKEQPNG
jgi:hypothetical protein